MKKTGSNEYLSSATIDYYNRFGSNRSFKKFLRIPKTLQSNKSCSDSSINEKCEFQEPEADFSRSLNNLKIIKQKYAKRSPHESKVTFEPALNSDDESEVSEYKELVKVKSSKKDEASQDNEKKESCTMTDLPFDNKKVNLNIQSTIEIKLPEQQTKQLMKNNNEEPDVKEALAKNPVQFYLPTAKILYCAETQTPQKPETLQNEEFITPKLKAIESTSRIDDSQTSPNESVTSKGQRLEWDSLADVGYNQVFNSDQAGSQNTVTKTIKTILERKDLLSDEKIVSLKTPITDKLPKCEKQTGRRRSLNFNENWLEVYTKYKNKYSDSKNFCPDAQSTPMEQIEARFTERCVQTSIKDFESKSIQVESLDEEENLKKPAMISLTENPSNIDNTLDSGSFVYIAGSPTKEKIKSHQTSPSKVSTENLVDGNQCKSKTQRSLTNIFESSSISKQHTSEVNSTVSSRNNSSSTESSSKDEKTTMLDEELKMAFTLMNSVLESKTMSNQMKKSLVNKIMQRIIELKISDQDSQKIDDSARENSKENSNSTSNTMEKSNESHSHKETTISSESNTYATSTNTARSKSNSIETSRKSVSIANSDDSTKSQKTDKIKQILVDNFVKDQLKPMTHSEVDYENHKHSLKSKSNATETSTLKSDQPVIKKKVKQLFHIEKEIERLLKLKEKMQIELNNKPMEPEKIYENIEDLRKLMRKNSETSEKNERARLCTPSSDKNLTNELLHRKEEFVGLYENQRGKLYESGDPTDIVYTRPYSNRMVSDSKDKPGSISDKFRIRSRPTSISSSEVLSSRSISVPIGNTITNTSTHQYDMQILSNKFSKAIETQTTDSLKRGMPIFYTKVKDSQKTVIYDKTKQSKQIQTSWPEAIAYSITFEESNKTKYSANKNENKNENDPPLEKVRTLTEYLNEKQPRTLKAMHQRNECIKELRRLRQLRNDQRQKLLLLTSESSLKEKIKNLPPPPLAQKRLFSTRALKLHSLKMYQNLPEKQKEREIDMINNLKRKNRVLKDLFNRNLQRKVLKGETDVSYSVNLFIN
uniref:CSON003100 protein n=1 Tax=Culicoides sonorensis TaxID=179676 RepID=A0A336MMV5_CULSO